MCYFSNRTDYKMKKITFLGGILLCLLMGLHTTCAQDSAILKTKVKKRLLLNQFESTYVLSASERIALKQSRLAHQYRTKKILDTLNISDRKRNKLMRELQRNPFSDYIQDVIADKTKPEKNLKE